MTHQTLREICKFLAGMVAAKIIIVFWLMGNGLLPLVLASTPYQGINIWPGIIFNVALLIIFFYYGWHVKSPVHSPTEHKLLLVAGVIFLIVAVVHFLRLAFNWSLVVGSLEIPIWVSWFGLVIAAYLSYVSFHFALRMRRR